MALQKIGITIILKSLTLILTIVVTFSVSTVVAQDTNDATTTSSPSPKGDDVFQQMLDYSRPGQYHQMLEELLGKWTFTGSHFEWTDSVTSKAAIKIFGTAVRKSFGSGRFFIVELTTGAKVQLPIRDGKMVEDYGRGIQTEGYNNVKKKFQISYINDHIGSDIWSFEGSYDSVSRTITLDGETELIPGMKKMNRCLFIFIDKDHYKWEFHDMENGKFRKASEMYFTRVK